MRHIRSYALGLMVLAGSAFAANAQATQKPERPRGEFNRGGMRGGPGGPTRGLMRGITLSDAEKMAPTGIVPRSLCRAIASSPALAMQPQLAQSGRPPS